MGGKVSMKILTIVLRIPIAIAMRKLIAKVWADARPDAQKRVPSEAGVRFSDALAWAALSGASVAATQLITRRTAEGTYRVVTGSEPPPPPPTKAEKKAAKKEAKEQKKLEKTLAKT